jgi:hypothetical protein
MEIFTGSLILIKLANANIMYMHICHLGIAGPLQLGAYSSWSIYIHIGSRLMMNLKCIWGTNMCEYDRLFTVLIFEDAGSLFFGTNSPIFLLGTW